MRFCDTHVYVSISLEISMLLEDHTGRKENLRDAYWSYIGRILVVYIIGVLFARG